MTTTVKDLSHLVSGTYQVLSKTNDVTVAKRALLELDGAGIDTTNAQTALEVYETESLGDDPETSIVAWDEFLEAVLNTEASAVEVNELRTEEVQILEPASAEATPAKVSAPEKPKTPKRRTTDPTFPVAEEDDTEETLSAKEDYAREYKWHNSDIGIRAHAQGVQIHVGFKDIFKALFATLGEPPLGQPDGLNILPYPQIGAWTSDNVYPEFAGQAGIDYYERLLAHFGLAFIYSTTGTRVHQLKVNPDDPKRVTFYAGTSKRNAALQTVARNFSIAALEGAPPIPEIPVEEPKAPKAPRAPKGETGSVVQTAPEVNPDAVWVFDEATFTATANEAFKVEITQTGTHVFANWEWLVAPEGTDVLNGKTRLKANTRTAGYEEVQKRFARGEFNG